MSQYLVIVLGVIQTSALGEGGRQKQTTVLISCMSVTVTRGEGVKKSENVADVLKVSPLTNIVSNQKKCSGALLQRPDT